MVGQIKTLTDAFAYDLIRQGFATDTDWIYNQTPPSSFLVHKYSPDQPKPNVSLSGELMNNALFSDDGQSLVDGAGNVVSDDYAFASGRAKNRTLKRFLDTVGVTAGNSGTAATVTIDSASPFGRPALKVALPAGNTWHEVQLTGLNIANFDGHVAWRIWVEDYTTLGQVQPFVGTSGYSRFYQNTHNVSNSNTNRFNGEHIVIGGPLYSAVINTFVGGTDTMSDAKIRIWPASGVATNVWVDVAAIPAVGRPTHVLTYDDCSVSWINEVLPYLATAGLTATFGINTGDLNGSPSLYLSSAQLQQIAAAGHQISAHNVTNTQYNDGTGGTQTAAQYTADFVTAQAALSAIVGGKMDPGYHPWVQGRTNGAVMDTMRSQGLKIARGTDLGYNFPQVGMGGHVLQLKEQAVHSLSTGNITDICANAKKYGTTVVWMIHEVTAAGGVGVETATAVHQHLINSIVASGGVSRTMGKLAEELYSERLVAASLLA